MGEIESVCRAIGVVMTIICVAASVILAGAIAGAIYLIGHLL